MHYYTKLVCVIQSNLIFIIWLQMKPHTDVVHVHVPSTPVTPQMSDPSLTSVSNSSPSSIITAKSAAISFPIYTDTDLINSLPPNSTGIDSATRNRLIRNTIASMTSVCLALRPARRPHRQEIIDVAIELCRRYPCLKDPPDLNIKKPWVNMFWILLFKVHQITVTKTW